LSDGSDEPDSQIFRIRLHADTVSAGFRETQAPLFRRSPYRVATPPALTGVAFRHTKYSNLTRILPVSQHDERQEAATREERVRLVADLISSMTERQLMTTHRKLTGTEPGSISDLI
jgi:hypothetical protein